MDGCLVISNYFLYKDLGTIIQLIAIHLFLWLEIGFQVYMISMGNGLNHLFVEQLDCFDSFWPRWFKQSYRRIRKSLGMVMVTFSFNPDHLHTRKLTWRWTKATMNEDVFPMKKLDDFSSLRCDPLMEGMPGFCKKHHPIDVLVNWPTEKGRRNSELQKGKVFKGLAWIFFQMFIS